MAGHQSNDFLGDVVAHGHASFVGSSLSGTFNLGAGSVSDDFHPSPRPWTVPRRLNPLFLGRDEVLSQIVATFAQDGTQTHALRPKIFVIWGIPGTGKSELSIKYATDYRHTYWAVFWVDCSSESSAQASFERIGREFGLRGGNVQAVCMRLASDNRRWLLILDNADDPDRDLQAYIPSHGDGDVIFTTRNPWYSSRYGNQYTHELLHLEPVLAQRLLLRAAGADGKSSDEEHSIAAKIVRGLDYHTLAIIQAGACIKETCKLEEYLPAFEREREHLLNYIHAQEYSARGSVYATFEVSITYLKRDADATGASSKAAADALALLDLLAFMHQSIPLEGILRDVAAYVASADNSHESEDRDLHLIVPKFSSSLLPDFARELARNKFGLPRWRAACSRLHAISLVRMHTEERMTILTMHPLMQKWAMDRQSAERRISSWISTASMIVMGSHYYVTEYHCLRRNKYGWSQASACFQAFPSENLEKMASEEVVRILYQLADLFSSAKMSHFAMKAIELCQAVYDHLETSPGNALFSYEIRICCARIIGNAGKRLQSLQLLKDIYRELAVVNLPQTLKAKPTVFFRACLDLAEAYCSSAQPEKGIRVLEETSKIYAPILTSGNTWSLSISCELARAYFLQGRDGDCISLLERSLLKSESDHPENRFFNSFFRSDLAVAYSKVGRAKDAVAQLEICREAVAACIPHDKWLMTSIDAKLITAYISDGQMENAKELGEALFRLFIGSTSFDDMDVTQGRLNLGLAYLRLHDKQDDSNNHLLERAIVLLETVVNSYAKTGDVFNMLFLSKQRLLASAYHRGKYYEKADVLLTDTLETLRKLVPKDDERIVDVEQELLQVLRARVLQGYHNSLPKRAPLADENREQVALKGINHTGPALAAPTSRPRMQTSHADRSQDSVSAKDLKSADGQNPLVKSKIPKVPGSRSASRLPIPKSRRAPVDEKSVAQT